MRVRAEDLPPLIRRADVMVMLGKVSEWKIRQLVQERKLTPLDMGGRLVMFAGSDVANYVNSLPEVTDHS